MEKPLMDLAPNSAAPAAPNAGPVVKKKQLFLFGSLPRFSKTYYFANSASPTTYQAYINAWFYSTMTKRKTPKPDKIQWFKLAKKDYDVLVAKKADIADESARLLRQPLVICYKGI